MMIVTMAGLAVWNTLYITAAARRHPELSILLPRQDIPPERSGLSMEFFCYHRDRPGSAALRADLLEQHWSYMDRFASQMIARGPTFADDGDTPTGSVHIVRAARPGRRPGVRLRRTQLSGRRVPGRAAAPVAQHIGPHDVGLPRRPERRQPIPGARPRRGPGRGPRFRPTGTSSSRTGRCCPTMVPSGWVPRCWCGRRTGTRPERRWIRIATPTSKCTTGPSVAGLREARECVASVGRRMHPMCLEFTMSLTADDRWEIHEVISLHGHLCRRRWLRPIRPGVHA